MNILLIDNYDSFTYNLKQYLVEHPQLEVKVTVVLNDRLDSLDPADYNGLVISPGPGLPEDAGGLLPLLHRKELPPTLGICLGMQALALAHGLQLQNLERVCHGLRSNIQLLDREEYLYRDLPPEIEVGRYHSWVVAPEGLENSELLITSQGDGVIMGLRHRHRDLHGLQFHPESVMTTHGRTIIQNFINHIHERQNHQQPSLPARSAGL